MVKSLLVSFSYACMEKLFEFVDKRYKEDRGEARESPEAKKPKTSDEL
jgi:hypothetical protein